LLPPPLLLLLLPPPCCRCCRYGAALFIKPSVVKVNSKRWAAFDATK
jgi:hypothetical protein